MEAPQTRPLSPKSVRTNSKFSQTFSRFKGIIRLPGGRKPSGNNQHATSPRRDDEGLDKGPYSPRGMGLKAYMSHPALGQLHPTRGHSPSQTGESDPDSSSSISPVERNYDSRLDFSPPRPSFQSQEQTDDLRTHSRAQSLHDMTHDHAQVTRRSRQAPPGNHISRTFDSPPTPATEGFKARNRSAITTHSSSEGATLGNPGRTSLERRPSKSRTKPQSEYEHPVPLIPASLKHPPQPPVELSMSTSTTSTITAAPKATHQTQGSILQSSKSRQFIKEERERPVNAPYRTAPSHPTNKKSVSSFVSSSGSSFVTADSHISTESETAPSTAEKALPLPPPVLEAPIPSNVQAEAESSPALEESPTTPMAKKALPNLKIPLPTRKFSLLSSGETARLSPSVFIRAPPLPILNLPKLTTPTSTVPDEESERLQRRRSRAAGLNAMPALPRQGTGRGTGGHEEHDMEDDVEEVDDEDDMGDGDPDYMDENETADSSLSTSASDMSEGRSSYDLGQPLSGGSSGSSAFSSDFNSLHQKPQLPPLNVASSPFTIRFPGSPNTATAQTPAGSFSLLAKGKGKLVTPREDEAEVPSRPSPMHVEGRREGQVASSLTRNNDSRGSSGSHYFDSIHGAPQRASLLASSSASRGGHVQALRPSPQATPGGSPRPPPIPPSPLQTPRPEDYRLSQHRFPPPPLPHSQSYSSNRDSVVSTMGGTLSAQRPSIYKHASRSLIDLHAVEKRQKVERMVREGEEEQEKEMRRKSMRRTRDSIVGNRDSLYSIRLDAQAQATQSRKDVIEEASSEGMDEAEMAKQGGYDNLAVQQTGGVSIPHTSGGLGASSKRESSVGGNSEPWKDEEKSQNRLSMAPAYDAGPHPLRKRRSMPVFNEASSPPPYPTFAPHPSARFANHTIQPRDDEGREVLPPYSNTIYLKAILPRKMEFSAPGLQAKDRKWRRVLCILEGTMLKVFKCPSGPGGVSVIEQWWEKKVGAGDVAAQAAVPTGPGSSRRPTPVINDRNLEEEKALNQYESGEPPVASVVLENCPPQPEPQPQRAGPSTTPYLRGKDHSQIALSKSALNIAVNLLKPPVGRHSRSRSHDGGPPSPRSAGPGTSRSSFDVSRSPTPAPSSMSSGTLGSRSHSPMPSASTSGTTPYGSESSIPSGSSSSHLSPPTARSGAPSTPPSSSRSRFRSATTSRTQSSTSCKTKDDVPEPGPDDLIRIYSLQNAESGLGNDYVKRKNVIRVRLEGEQFLLQAPDVSSVVEWIEGLQAATNIALDLDTRPMPRGPIFPRRRRRRRPQIAPISTNGISSRPPGNATETYTPQSATAGQPALRRS